MCWMTFEILTIPPSLSAVILVGVLSRVKATLKASRMVEADLSSKMTVSQNLVCKHMRTRMCIVLFEGNKKGPLRSTDMYLKSLI